jgi:hypothetical protein
VEIQATWQRAIRVWWAFVWRWFLAAVGCEVGLILVAMVLILVHFPKPLVIALTTLAFLVFMFWIAIRCLEWIQKPSLGDFRLTFLPPRAHGAGASAATRVEATSGRLWRFWWTLFWRFFAVSAIGWIPFLMIAVVLVLTKLGPQPGKALLVEIWAFLVVKQCVDGAIAFKWALSDRNDLGDFRLALVPAHIEAATEAIAPAPPTL